MSTPDDKGLSRFDRLANVVSDITAKAWFFAACALVVLLWGPSYFLFQSIDTWQLVINTTTTIVTFLLVALLQNTQRRSDRAIQCKLNAIAEALADLMEAEQAHDPSLAADIDELRHAVGIEHREGT